MKYPKILAAGLLLLLSAAASCQKTRPIKSSQLSSASDAFRVKPRFAKILRDANPHFVGLFPQPAQDGNEPPILAIELADCSQAAAAAMLGLPLLQEPELLSESNLAEDNNLGLVPPLKCTSGSEGPSWPNLGPISWVAEQERYFASLAAGTYISIPYACRDQLVASGFEALAMQGIDEDHFELPQDMTRELQLSCGRGPLEPLPAPVAWTLYRFETGLSAHPDTPQVTERRFVAVHKAESGTRRVLTILSVDGYSYTQIVNGRRRNGAGQFINPVQGPKFEALYSKLFQFFGYPEAPKTVPDGAPESLFQKPQVSLAPELLVHLCFETCATASPGAWIRTLSKDGDPTSMLTPVPATASLKVNTFGESFAQLLPGWKFPRCFLNAPQSDNPPGLSFLDHLGIRTGVDSRSFTLRMKEAQRAADDRHDALQCPSVSTCRLNLPDGADLLSHIFDRPPSCAADTRALEIQLGATARIRDEELVLDKDRAQGFEQIILSGPSGGSRIRVELDCGTMENAAACATGEALKAFSVRDGRRLLLRNIRLEPGPDLISGSSAAPLGVNAFEVSGSMSTLAHHKVEILPCSIEGTACSFEKGVQARDGANYYAVDTSISARHEAVALFDAQGSLLSSTPAGGISRYLAPARMDEWPVDKALRAVSAQGHSELVLRNVELAAPHALFVYQALVDGTQLNFKNSLEHIPGQIFPGTAIDVFDSGRVLLQAPQMLGFSWIANFDAFADSLAGRMDRKLEIRSPRQIAVQEQAQPVLFFVPAFHCIQPGPQCL